MSTTVVEATGLGLRTRQGWVFRDVDLRVDAGELLALTGDPGSGRTSLLLALAGRFVTSSGKVTRTGPVALGHIPGVHEPDPALTLTEHVEEGLLLLGERSRSRRRQRIEATIAYVGEVMGEPLDPRTRGRQLTPVQRQVLGLGLAALGQPRLILADDVDAGLDSTERARIWQALAELSRRGYAVIATAREVDPAVPARSYHLEAGPAVPARSYHLEAGPKAAPEAGPTARTGPDPKDTVLTPPTTERNEVAA